MVNCPKCGREMRYIDQYGRWYCDFCKEYAPAGYTGQNTPPVSAQTSVQTPVQKKESVPLCPKCGNPLTYIKEYDRWYCHNCKEYAPAGYAGQNAPQVSAQTPVHGKESAPLCPKCGRPLTYIKEYDRWYCYNCKEYAPKDISPPPSASMPAQSPTPVAQQPTKIMQPVQQNASQTAVRRIPSHSHAGDPGTGGWVMLLGLLLVLTDEMIYILLMAGAISNLNPPTIGGGRYGPGLPLYGYGLGSLLGITGLLIFMIGGVMAALASRVR